MGLYLLVTGDFVKTGGMDRANHALACYLARRGDEIHLVAYRVADDLLAYPNVVFHRVPKPAKSYFLAAPLLDRVGRHWAKWVSARGGRVIVNGGNCQWPDVNWVHYVHAAYTPEVVGSFYRWVKGRWHHRASLAAERKALRGTKVVIANSFRTKLDLIEHVGVSADRIHVVYLGVDSEVFCPATVEQRIITRSQLRWPANRPMIAFIGALGDRRKGFDTLFDAWAALCGDSQWDADLVVIGSGAELPVWRSRATAAGLESRIRFLAFRDDIPRLLQCCDALVAPARYEAFGLAVQEALCCGLPVIVSRSSGVAECCPAEFRELMIDNPDDVNELKQKLSAWREYRHSIGPVATAAVNALRRRTWACMAEEFIGVLNGLALNVLAA